MSVTLSLARCHFPVRGLGFGARTGIWLQGCSIHCAGCIVPETWTAGPEHEVDVARLLAALQPWLEQSDGVTISGGEPFDQPRALVALLAGLRVLCRGDLLVYSGYSWDRLSARHAPVLARCDAVVAGPFVRRREERTALHGSANQEVRFVTPLGRERYRRWREFAPAASIALDGDALRMAGIIPRESLVAISKAVSRDGRTGSLTHGAV